MPRYEAGDYVKVEFKDANEPIGEWMWVKVESCDERQRLVFGTLDSEPLGNYDEKLALGSRLAVSFDKIKDHRKPAEFTKQ
jgi:hypothetical protein